MKLFMKTRPVDANWGDCPADLGPSGRRKSPPHLAPHRGGGLRGCPPLPRGQLWVPSLGTAPSKDLQSLAGLPGCVWLAHWEEATGLGGLHTWMSPDASGALASNPLPWSPAST